ncbi:unnamed protein product [Danaus chrysippus]|uniref:Protein aurora borealis n=1 Tax=Danaus chrysippus TaxID=151541 RepID=A0A8J2QFB6_9NEOP|nr:unnamed protein product [Danaus chrysippus]
MSNKNDSPNNRKATPPTKGKIRNPFDKVLIEKLHKPICSPGMCKIYKKKNRGSFRWDIDQACVLVPADIVACNSQFEPSPDVALEKIAEEANEKFFSQEMVMPSPMETSKKVIPLQTSLETSIQINTSIKESIVTRDVSAQTILTLPPKLPPELENLLKTYYTYTQDQSQNIFDEYEVTANGSLRRKLFFEERDIENSDHYDSEQTDDEIHVEARPSSSYEAHTPVTISPNLSCNQALKGMKRTFGTPLCKGQNKPSYRNKILDVVDFCLSPIEFRTPKRCVTTSSLASVSPIPKTLSSDDEKNNFTSPESEAMATCLSCIESETEIDRKSNCFCITPTKIILKRSTSLKDSPHRNRKGSLSEKRSLSMSSLNRSRSVQKLDFSMDMSIDGSVHDKSQESSPKTKASWSIVEDSNFNYTKATHKESHEVQSSTKLFSVNLLDDTPIKGKHKTSVLTHEISKIRGQVMLSPLHMSLDNSLDNFDIPLSMEEKKIDFNTVDLKLLTENSQFDSNRTESSIFKRVDSGFNENTFYTNASSYYESAIKPSELTITKQNQVLKEISNVNWMRVDSGFNDTDSMQLYDTKKNSRYHAARLQEKENVDEFDRLNKNDPMSMSDFITEDITFNCNFSSTPSKTKSRKVNS